MKASVSPVSEAPPAAVVAGPRRPNWPAFYWLATVALIVTILARAQTILVPVALSVVVAFALGPLVKRLERRLRRAPAVIVVAVVTLAAVAAFGYLLERQLVDLSAQMTKYSDSIGKKVVALRGPSGGALSGLSKSVDRVVRNLDEQVAANQDARPVRVVPAQATAMERIQDTLAPIAEPVGRAVIVLVLVIVLLMKREDIRDRFIRLVGRGHVTLTTRTLDEAGQRISRFLAYQSAINGAFGVLIAAGLFSIGIPYAPLWGFVAAIFRFVPFVGTAIMMIFPAALAFAQFPGWWQMLATLGLFVGLDMLTGYVAEPMLIGAKTGVCVIAIPPGGLTQARYICRRLRAKLAATPILVIRPGLQADAKDSAGRLIDDGASQVCFTLVEAHAVAEHHLVAACLDLSRKEIPSRSSPLATGAQEA